LRDKSVQLQQEKSELLGLLGNDKGLSVIQQVRPADGDLGDISAPCLTARSRASREPEALETRSTWARSRGDRIRQPTREQLETRWVWSPPSQVADKAGDAPRTLSVRTAVLSTSGKACDSSLLMGTTRPEQIIKDMGRPDIPSSFFDQLLDQFQRLDTERKGCLSTEECHAVVAKWEAQMYGHTQHDPRRVCQSLQIINCLYGGGRSSSSMEIPATLALETFLRFMVDDHAGDSIIYMKKAFTCEAADFLSAQARQHIADRHKNDQDPQPTGWQAFLLNTLPPMVILTNALVLGLQADIATEARLWDFVESGFFAFYLLEFLLKMKLLGFVRYFRGNDGYWNFFDVLCLMLSLMDVVFTILKAVLSSTELFSSGPTNMMKVLRLARLARIIRSFRYKLFSDLKTMVLGVLSGARVLFWAIILFFLCIYIVGVFMRELVGDEVIEFSNVPAAMFSVFRCFTDGCSGYTGTPLHESLRRDYGAVFMVGYILMFLVVTVGVFNLIMAIFIDNVVSTNTKRKQQDLGMREQEMKVGIEEMVCGLLKNVSPKRGQLNRHTREDLLARSLSCASKMAQIRQERMVISRELFNTWLTDPDVLSLLEEVDVDTATKAEIFDVCDVDKSGSLTPDELVSGLMRLRGPISKCDVIAIRLKVRYLTKMLEDIHTKIGM